MNRRTSFKTALALAGGSVLSSAARAESHISTVQSSKTTSSGAIRSRRKLGTFCFFAISS